MTFPTQMLIDGFVRFRARHYEQGDSQFQQLVAQGQTPKTMVVACCDSRVDPALVLDCAPGDLFVIRNVANLVPPSEGRIGHHGTSAALEFGVRNLGVEHIIVLGHAHCGGIQALVKTGGLHNPGSFIDDWMHLAESARASVVQDMPHASLEEQVRACQALLKFGGLGHTSVIHATDPARIREYGLRIPSFRVLVNTPAPQGSTGITTGLQPAMTLGCGAMAGNATSDNIGPLHLINIRRLAMVIRNVEDAFESPLTMPAVTNDSGAVKEMVASAVERFLTQRGLGGGSAPASPAAAVVDRFLSARAAAEVSCGCAAPVSPAPAVVKPPEPSPVAPPPPPAIAISDLVCEADVRAAMNSNRKIHIGPRTIVTPSARELGNQHDILVTAQRS